VWVRDRRRWLDLRQRRSKSRLVVVKKCGVSTQYWRGKVAVHPRAKEDDECADGRLTQAQETHHEECVFESEETAERG
jgi:hypothetical protein